MYINMYMIDLKELEVQTYSIADARSQLPKIIHTVEAGDITQLTRRGKPVAVLLSVSEYKSLLKNGEGNLFLAFKAFKSLKRVADEQTLENGLTDSEIESWRDKSAGRNLPWE